MWWLFAIIVLAWIISGALIARYGLDIREGLLLAPVSLAIGPTLHFFLLNWLLRTAPIGLVTWFVTGLLLCIGLGCYWYNRHRVAPLMLACSGRTALALVLLWAVLAVWIWVAKGGWGEYEEHEHAPRAALLARVGMPFGLNLPSWVNPDHCDYYHYGENLMLGVLSHQTGVVDLVTLSRWRVTYNLVASIGLAFTFCWLVFQRRRVGWAVLGALLLVVIGPGQWIAEIHHWPFLQDTLQDSPAFAYSRNLTDYVALDPFGNLKPIPTTNNLMLPMAEYMSSPNPTGFLMTALLCLVAWLGLMGQSRGWLWYVGLGILSATPALFFTTGILMVVLPVGIYGLWQVWQERHAPYAASVRLITFGLAALSALVLQGGIITNTLFCEPYGEAFQLDDGVITRDSLARLEFDTSPSYASSLSTGVAATQVNLLSPSNWINVWIDWGGGLFLYPIILAYSLYRRNGPAVTLLLAVGGSFLLAFVVKNAAQTYDNYRYAVIPIWFVGALSVLFWADLWEWSVGWRYSWGKIVIILALISLSLTGILNFMWASLQPPYQSRILDPIDYQIQAEWRNRLDPLTERVWDPNEEYIRRKGAARAVLVFGTYLNKNATFNLGGSIEPEMVTWRITGQAGNLRAAGYRYLYLDQDWLANPANPVSVIQDPTQYRLIQEWRDESAGLSRYLYEIIGDQYTPTGGNWYDLLTPTNQSAYNAFTMPIQWTAETLTFNPSTGDVMSGRDRYLNELALWVNQVDDPSAKTTAFILLTLLSTAQHEAETSLTFEQAEWLQEWRNSKHPDWLRRIGIDYLLVDTHWLGYLSPSEYEIFHSRDQYILLGQWSSPLASGELPMTYWLYQVP
jgi:hypothetical protein